MRRLFVGLSLSLCLGLAPLTADAAPKKVLIHHIEDGNPARLKLRLGAKDGVQVGVTGYFVDLKGQKVPGVTLKVTGVEEKSCWVEASIDASKIDGDWEAVLDVP